MNKIFSIAIGLFLLTSDTTDVLAIEPAKSAKKLESLTYNAYWHWGFIWKLAGSGTLNLWEEQVNDNATRFHGQLCGRSRSIVESIMKVRDTLDCYYTPELIPLEYCKKTNEGNYHAIERNYYHSFADGTLQRDAYHLKREDVDSTSIDVYRWRIKKGDDRKKLKNDGVGFDMLSIFYELRNIDYSKLRPGQKLEYHITSGIKNRGLHVKYKGRETCTLKNGRKYPAYLVELTFSTKDSDSTPLQAWLSTDPDHRPLSVVINLKRIGAVQGEIVE